MSKMLKEANESPDVISRQLADSVSIDSIVAALAPRRPRIALTVARGSSDHAAAYFGSLVMAKLGIPVSSFPMSVATLRRSAMQIDGELALAFSQSGKSPDLIETMASLRRDRAHTIAAVNEPDTPLSGVCEWSLPLLAGPEESVAATKSFIAMLGRSAQLVSSWNAKLRGERTFVDALSELPEALHRASRIDWSRAVEELRDVERMIIVGRGYGLAIAQEAALKLKETSGIQAEAFSSAEVRHGPMELIDSGYPLLVFATNGPEQSGLLEFAKDMRLRGARVLVAAQHNVETTDLPIASIGDPALEPILAILTFYVMTAQLAVTRGRDPDVPRHLKKVTETH